MTCDELRDGYDTFAIGMEEVPEAAEIRQHLGANCPNCVPGIRNSLQLIARMSGLVEVLDPPARLRKRVIALVKPSLLDQPPRSSSWGWSAVWGATSIVFLTVAVLFGIQARRLSELRFADLTHFRATLGILAAADSEEVSFGGNRTQPPRGRVVVNRRIGVVLIASNLPAIPSGKAFEMWLIPRGAKPIASGVFRAGKDGTAVVTHAGAMPQDLSTVAVTVENEAGVDSPTSTPIIAAETR